MVRDGATAILAGKPEGIPYAVHVYANGWTHRTAWPHVHAMLIQLKVRTPEGPGPKVWTIRTAKGQRLRHRKPRRTQHLAPST